MRTIRAFAPVLILLDLAASLATIVVLNLPTARTTHGEPVRHPAVTWDGHALHYSPSAFRSSCKPLSFTIEYSDGEETWTERFDPCQSAYLLPLDPTRCAVEHWTVRTAAVVYGEGRVPSCIEP